MTKIGINILFFTCFYEHRRSENCIIKVRNRVCNLCMNTKCGRFGGNLNEC